MWGNALLVVALLVGGYLLGAASTWCALAEWGDRVLCRRLPELLEGTLTHGELAAMRGHLARGCRRCHRGIESLVAPVFLRAERQVAAELWPRVELSSLPVARALLRRAEALSRPALPAWRGEGAALELDFPMDGPPPGGR